MIVVTILAVVLSFQVSGYRALPFIAIGAIAWIVSVGLKFAWALPTNKPIISFFKKKLPPKISDFVSWSYVGLMTGVFECGVALLFVLLLPQLHNADWYGAMSFGVGFGTIEAVFTSFVALVPKFRRERNVIAKSLSAIPAAIIERIFTLFVHVFTKVLIVLSVQQANPSFFWLSFGLKSLLDGIAAFGIMKWKILDKLSRLWIMELIVVVFGLTSVLGLWLLYNTVK